MRKKERLSYIKIKADQGIEEMEEKYNHYKDLPKRKNSNDEIEEGEENKHEHDGR